MFRANNLEITIKNLLMTINSGNFQFRQNIENAVKPVLSGHPYGMAGWLLNTPSSDKGH